MRFCCWLWFQITTNVCIFVSKCALLLLALVSNNDKRGSVSHCIPVAHTARAGWPTPPTGIAVLLHAIPVTGDIQPLIVVLESTMVQLPGKPVPSVPALYPLPPSSRRLPCLYTLGQMSGCGFCAHYRWSLAKPYSNHAHKNRLLTSVLRHGSSRPGFCVRCFVCLWHTTKEPATCQRHSVHIREGEENPGANGGGKLTFSPSAPQITQINSLYGTISPRAGGKPRCPP